jgi:hypothetical protein
MAGRCRHESLAGRRLDQRPTRHTAASTAERGDENTAHTPSPVCLNIKPPCASIAVRNTLSCLGARS